MSGNIRLRPQTHHALKEIVAITGESMQDTVDRAVEELRRKIYLEGLSRDYAVLRADPKQSKAFDRENAAWDRSNRDGLESR